MTSPSPARTWGLVALGAALVGGPVSACARPQPVRKEMVDAPAVGSANLALARMQPLPSIPSATPVAKEARKSAEPSPCPEGMVLVEGDYCPEVEQKCLEWMDPPGSRYRHFRCKHYAKSVCKSKTRVHMRFCIDVTERVEEGSDLPRNHMSWTASKKLCEAAGARLCRESEWQFACEGEEMRPYPYGWNRDPTACNVDISQHIGRPGHLVDHRTPVGSHEKCASPFGVQDMAGNLEEWVQADGRGKKGWKEVLKGSWWIPSRHACRQYQIGHNDVYSGAETGTRCCKDAPPSEIASR